MANGYLGKISAIVSANTGDFAAKLNGSAKEVARFASTVESTIGSASRAAATSLANIYTPLQKLERALQAASSMKLSFKGFAGAIKDVDALKQRMTSLSQRQVDVILKASGLESINKFKDAVQGLNSKQFDVLLRVGGVEKLKEIREQIAAGRGEFEVVAQTREAEVQIKALQQQINAIKSAGPVVVTVDADAVNAAQRELNSFVREQSKALTGVERPTPKRFRSDIESRLASEQAGLEGAAGRQAERDRLMAAATSDRARKNIGKNYAGVDEDVSARAAAVEKLKESLAGLEQREKALKAARAGTSSDADLKEYEQQLVSLKQKHQELAKEASKRISAAVGVDIGGDELEKVLSGAIERGEILERVFKEAGLEGTAAFEKVVAVLKELGVSDMEATVTKFRQMASVTEEITKPLGEVSRRLAGLGVDVQSGFQPALASSQAAAERLVEAIRSGEQPAAALEALFADVRKEVVASEQAVSRLAGASQMLGNLKTGREVSFTSPELTASLSRGAEIGNSAASLPASALSANPQIAERLIEIKRLSDLAVAALGKLESAKADGFSMGIDVQNAELRRLLSLLGDVQDKASEEIKVLLDTADAERKAKSLEASLVKMRENVDFTITGRVQNFDQARQEMSRLQGQVGELKGGRSPFNMPLRDLGALIEEGDVGKLNQVRDLIRQIDSLLASRKEFEVNVSEASAELAKFSETIESLKQRADFVITGKPQNLDQVRSELEGLLGDIRKVEAVGREGLQVRVNAVIEALGRQDLDAANEELEHLRTAAADVIPVKVDASKAIDSISRVNENRARQATNFRQGFGGGGDAGLNLGLDQRSLQSYTAQMQILQQAISRGSAEARGPAVAAFERLRQAVATAFDEGRIDAESTRAELARLRGEAVKTAAAAGGVSVGALGRDVQRAGDVGRGGFDKLSLALNQGAFAIDDFLSSTGGLEFKLRAISNNVTQLGFVLGGTTGLFVGLGAVIAGQAAVQIVRWASDGKTAEDQTKALNDTLARQKGLVEELAQAFQSLGDAARRGTFSPVGEDESGFRRQIEDVRRKQRQAQEDRAAAIDPRVQSERAQQGALQKRLEQSTDAGQRLVLEQRIRESKDRERMAVATATDRPAPTASQAATAIKRAGDAAFAARTEGEETVTPRDAAILGEAADRAEQAATGNDGQMRAALVSQRRSLQDSGLAEDSRVSREIRRLTAMIDSLESPTQKAVNDLANSVVEASRGPAAQIRQAQEEVARAIEAGIPGAMEFQKQLDENAKKLEEAYKGLEQAAEGKDERGRDLSPEEQEARVNAAKATVDELEARRAEIAEQTNRLSTERIVDPQRQIDARINRSRQNLNDARADDGTLARQLRQIESERAELGRRRELPNADIKGIAASEAALNKHAAAVEATTIALKLFGDALNRSSDEAKGNLTTAQSRADETRRQDLGYDTQTTRTDASYAQMDLERQRELEAQAQIDLGYIRDKQQELEQGPEFQRMRQINEMLKGDLNAEQRDALREERADLEAKVRPQREELERQAQAAVEPSTREAERARMAAAGRTQMRTLWNPDFEFDEETLRRRRELKEGLKAAGIDEDGERGQQFLAGFDRERAEAARTQTLAGRGAEAARTDRERFSLDINKPNGLVESITARRKQLEAQGVDQAGQAAFLNSAIREQMDETSPMLAQFRDERENARLQGPSRARLTSSDISTGQGQAELSRLLRGEDPANDVNLAELKKQTGKFEELIEAVKANNPNVL